MNADVYLFGNLGMGYTQFPAGEEKSSVFNKCIRLATSPTQVIVHREDNLMYYSYIRHLGKADGVCIGINLLLNGALITDIKALFRVFEESIGYLAQNGLVIRLDEEGELAPIVQMFDSKQLDIQEARSKIVSLLDEKEVSYSTLPPVNYGIQRNGIKEFFIDDDVEAIVSFSHKVDYTVVYKDVDNNSSNLNSSIATIAKLRAENRRLAEQCDAKKCQIEEGFDLNHNSYSQPIKSDTPRSENSLQSGKEKVEVIEYMSNVFTSIIIIVAGFSCLISAMKTNMLDMNGYMPWFEWMYVAGFFTDVIVYGFNIFVYFQIMKWFNNRHDENQFRGLFTGLIVTQVLLLISTELYSFFLWFDHDYIGGLLELVYFILIIVIRKKLSPCFTGRLPRIFLLLIIQTICTEICFAIFQFNDGLFSLLGHVCSWDEIGLVVYVAFSLYIYADCVRLLGNDIVLNLSDD